MRDSPSLGFFDTLRLPVRKISNIGFEFSDFRVWVSGTVILIKIFTTASVSIFITLHSSSGAPTSAVPGLFFFKQLRFCVNMRLYIPDNGSYAQCHQQESVGEQALLKDATLPGFATQSSGPLVDYDGEKVSRVSCQYNQSGIRHSVL